MFKTLGALAFSLSLIIPAKNTCTSETGLITSLKPSAFITPMQTSPSGHENSFSVKKLTEDCFVASNMQSQVLLIRSFNKIQDFDNEVRILGLIDPGFPFLMHPIAMIDSQDETKPINAMAYPLHRSLQDYYLVKKHESTGIPESNIRYIFAQLVIAMEYLHSKHIIYQNFELKNVWLAEANDESPLRIELGDFSHFRLSTEPNNFRSEWMIYNQPPELVRKSGIRILPDNPKSVVNEAVDFYGLGHLIYRLLFEGWTPVIGPLHGNEKDMNADQRRWFFYAKLEPFKLNYYHAGLKIDGDLLDLVASLLQENVSERLAAGKSIKAHKWFECINWNVISQLDKNAINKMCSVELEKLNDKPRTCCQFN